MDDGSGGAGNGGDSGSSGQQLGTVAVAGDKWLWTSSPQLAKMADGCDNRNMTNGMVQAWVSYFVTPITLP